MRKLTFDEINKFEFKQSRFSFKADRIRKAVAELKPGEGLFVKNEESGSVHGPMQLLGKIKKATGMNYSCRTLRDGSGWVVVCNE